MPAGVRFAGPGDVPALVALAAATFPLACPPGTDAADIAEFIATNLTVDEFAAHVASPTRVVLVHETGGVLDGYVLMFGASEVRPEPSFGVTREPSAYLSKCYVLPGVLGGSVAGPLMDAAKQAAVGVLGAGSIWLNTNVANERAARFYRKHGFQRVGGKQMQVGAALMDDDVFEVLLPAG